MSPTSVRASAPSRIDLAGGTLDIWPISALVPGAVTVNLAIDLPATVTVRPRDDGKLSVVSLDRKRRVTRKLPIGADAIDGPLSLLLRLAAASDLATGARMECRATAPAGAGLGGSSTLAVAATAALARFAGRALSRRDLLARVMNVEAAEIRVPTGNQDYLAAIHGGLAAYHHTPDGPRREALPLDRAFVDRLVLGYTGRPRDSGFSNWDMFRRFIEGNRQAVRRMESIAKIAGDWAAAARARDWDRCGELLAEEGALRAGLAPSVVTPQIRRAGKAARAAGAVGMKVCGAGGGGCIVAFAREGRRDDVGEALRRSGVQLLDVRASPRGVRLQSPAD